MTHNYVNVFEFTGTVVFCMQKDKNVLIRIATAPFGHVDYPFVIISNNDKNKLVDMNVLKRGKRITVKGYVSTNKKYQDGTFIVTEAVIEKSRLEAMLENADFVPDKNTIIFKGIVASNPFPFKNNDGARFTLQTVNPKGKNVFPRIVAFNNIANRALKIPVNTPLACLCKCNTKVIDQKTVHSISAQYIETI